MKTYMVTVTLVVVAPRGDTEFVRDALSDKITEIREHCPEAEYALAVDDPEAGMDAPTVVESNRK